MNLIVNNTTKIVWTQTDSEISQANGNYQINGINVGIPVSENTVVENATLCPFPSFFPETFTYVDGVWAIGNQDFYDQNMAVMNYANKLNVDANRHAAYVAESDPLFFKAQRGEATMEEWQAKVAEIKQRYPKV